MPRTRRLVGTMAGLLAVGLLETTIAAQDAPRSVILDEELLVGTTWQLSQFAADDGTATDVPDDVTATLLLEDGTASGSGGCNEFSTAYELVEHVLRFDAEIIRTEARCEGPAQNVEDAYLDSLSTVVAWDITDGRLQLYDGDSGAPVLVFADGTFPIAMSDFYHMTIQLEDQADAIERLTQQISNLESGSGDANGEPATTKPEAPTTRGDVQRQFAELGADPERGLVEWVDRADDEDAYLVWARRIQCVKKGGEVKEQPSPWVRVARLPANTESYRPRHDEIVGQIEPQNRKVVGSGALYELSVAARNDAGRSGRTLVGAYFIAPEYSCP